jgi:hypothetical protein
MMQMRTNTAALRPDRALPYSVALVAREDREILRPEPQAPILALIAASIERSGVNSITPQFPQAVGANESTALYRQSCQRLMRAWLTYAISDLVIVPLEGREAQVVAEHLATQEIGRGLYANETKLLQEAVRDILTAQTIMEQMELEDVRDRLHTPGRMFA